MGSEAGDASARDETAEEFDVLPPIKPEIKPNRGLGEKLRWAFETQYMNLHGYVAATQDQTRLNAILPRFDLVWVLNSRTANILQRWSWPGAHLDFDDIPSTYARTIAENSSQLGERLKARLHQPLLRRRERFLLQRFTTLSVCSEADREYLDSDDRIHVIPNGFQRPAFPPVRATTPTTPRIGFIGLYSYAPNLDGVRWFLANCWPKIRQAVPGIRLRLVGKDTDGPLRPADPDVDALGWVNDPAAEISTWSTMIIPIRFGGGTRIKIAEAFGRRCPAVSTRVGAFGYEVQHDRQLLLADSADDFSRACIDLVRHPERGSALADRAWRDFLDRWTWDAIARKVTAAAEDCMKRRRTRSVEQP